MNEEGTTTVATGAMNGLATSIAQKTIERIRQSDADALLLSSAFTLGMGALALTAAGGDIEPRPKTTWDNYVEGWEADVNRRINDRFNPAASQPVDGGSGGTGSGPVAGVGNPAPSGDPNVGSPPT